MGARTGEGAVRLATWVLAIFGFCVLAIPVGAEPPQGGKSYRIGYLDGHAAPPEAGQKNEPIWQALRDLGYVEGVNLTVDRRYAGGQEDRLATLAAELIALHPDAIFALGGAAGSSAKAATDTIPIVVMSIGDPVGVGLVKSLAHPGGNVTGVTEVSTELASKRLEILKEAVPSATRVGVLWNEGDPGMTLRYRRLEAVAPTLGVTIEPLSVRKPEDFDAAFSQMKRERPDALLIISDMLTTTHQKQIVDFADLNRLPTMYEFRELVRGGGLISYGPSVADLTRRCASYIDKILRGAKPSELPMEQPTQYYLVINKKTANAIEFSIPPDVIIRADEVIQ
jgi:putative tryptophan/tyrosine transport system substrate-binding protein